MLRTLLSAAALAAIASSASANIIITEAHSMGNSNATYGRDWFELTNTGNSPVNITGWKVDDDSNAFGSALTLQGVTSIPAKTSVIFMEAGSADTTGSVATTAFKDAWFGSNVPSGFLIGFYTGSGIGLSSGGDQVNIFDSTGVAVASIAIGTGTAGFTFDNSLATTGLPSTTITTLSSVGTNGAFTSVTGGEVGSPGLIPEPASLGLLGLGALAMGRRRRA